MLDQVNKTHLSLELKDDDDLEYKVWCKSCNYSNKWEKEEGEFYYPVHVVMVFIPFNIISETTSVLLDEVYKIHPLISYITSSVFLDVEMHWIFGRDYIICGP